MRVAYVTMQFPAPSETFAATDIRALRDSGVAVSVFTMRPPLGDPASVLNERGLPGISVSQGTFVAYVKGLASCLRRPVLAARFLWWLVRVTWKRPAQFAASLVLLPRSMGIFAELQRERPDVVHLFWCHYPSMVGYLVLTALPESALSVFLGAYDLAAGYGGTTWVTRRAALISTHARWNFPAIVALGVPVGRIHLAYRGIDPALFAGARRKIARRIVSVGRLESYKGVHDVLQVFCRVLARWPDATLTVIGEGEERASLDRAIESLGIGSAVTFPGHVPQRDVAIELSAAEVLLHMSWAERLPNVVKEAMASRCVCVVTGTHGIDELVADGRTGFVVQVGDIEAAAARIDDVFSGRVDVESLLDAATEHIARHFDVITSMRSYRQRWTDLLATGPRGRHPKPVANRGVSDEGGFPPTDAPIEDDRTLSRSATLSDLNGRYQA